MVLKITFKSIGNKYKIIDYFNYNLTQNHIYTSNVWYDINMPQKLYNWYNYVVIIFYRLVISKLFSLHTSFETKMFSFTTLF